MKLSLEGKIILVTGAAQGIGAAIPRAVSEAGAEGLVLVDKSPIDARFDAATQEITADLVDPSAPDRIVEQALARFGRIDGLVNAAGLTTRGAFTDAGPALWEEMMAVNARAPFFLMAGAIRDMLSRSSGGSIVNIQSINAHCGAPELAIYSASKGALQTMTKNAANAHLSDRIRVNGINLGWADTQTERHLHAVTLGRGPDWLDQAAARQPLGRLIGAEECARQAVWMLSPASAPLTGVCFDLEQAVTGAP